MTAPTRSIRPRRSTGAVLGNWLWQGRYGLGGWALGLIAAASLYLPLFPSMRSDDMTHLLDSLPPALIDTLGFDEISTGAGYTQATLFGMIGFVLITIAAVSWGAVGIAGAEESGQLELTLAHGVSRVQYAVETAAAVVIKIVVLGVVAATMVGVFNGSAELELTFLNIVAVTVAWMGTAALSASAALATGAFTGRKSWSLGVGAGVAVVGYVLQALANNSSDLDWVRNISPYDWAFGSAPLTNGFDAVGLLLLWGGTAVLLVASVVGVARRDILG